MARKSKLSTRERQEVVLMLLRREEPAAALARRYGVSEPTLYRWREDFLAAGKSALTDKAKKGSEEGQQIRQLERELEKREQVVGEYVIANRILKKKWTACCR